MRKELWLRLRNYHFDDIVPPHLADHVLAIFGRTDASTKAFASKIGRKHNWPPNFAQQAVEEYKKFVYLGVVSDFPVTPPKVIDIVWHEHILFSRAYREFCRDVIQRDFDHNPELVPTAEQTGAFESQYHRTLELYVSEFNRRPPGKIWGTPKFQSSTHVWSAESSYSGGTSDTPLYLHFEGDGHSHGDMSEFGGGGGFSGGGGGSSWDDSSNDSSSDSSSDSSGSDSGGSGCSSGCGGGGE